MSKIINLRPSNNLWKELGNNTYTFDEALSELIDNSISAADKQLECVISVEFYLNQSNIPNLQTCEKIIVRDNASGIKEEDIPICFTPAGKQTKRSLNEHGLGFKQSISTLGNLIHFKSKHKDEDGFVIKEFSFDLEVFKDSFQFNHGTEISISPDDKRISNFNINSNNFHSKIHLLYYQFGSRYRYLLTKNNIKINLRVVDVVNNDIYEKVVEPIFPIYFHPYINNSKGRGGTAKPLIYNKKFITSNGAEALLTFGFHPKDSEEYERIGEDPEIYKSKSTKGKWNKHVNHPYCWSPSSEGLDIIMNDRVIKFHQCPEIGLTGTRESWYSAIRGELKLISGFKTTSTKNEIVRTEDYDEVLEQIRFYLTNGDDKDIPESDISLYKNEFERNLISYAKDMLKKSDSEMDYNNEDELKDKIEKNLKSPLSKYKNVYREYPIQALGVISDFLVDDCPWEVKNHETDSHDISQLLTYIISLDVKYGVFVAPNFTESCYHLTRIIEDKLNIKIELMKTSLFQ